MQNDFTGSPLSARGLSINALFAALLAVTSLVAVQLPGSAVPVTLQVIVVVLIALILPPSWAAVSVGTYLLAGAIGLPVFAGGRGGLSVLVGPTGGYIFGFLVGAVAGAWVRRAAAEKVPSVVADGAAALAVIACVYFIGWLQLMLVTGVGPVGAFAGGVIPFLIPDALKAGAAVAIAPMMRRAARL